MLIVLMLSRIGHTASPFTPQHRSPMPSIVVIERQSRWIRLRVQGLLRNEPLARRLAAAVPGVDVRAATGTVRVSLDGARDEGWWIRELTAVADGAAPSGASRRPRPPAGRPTAAPPAAPTPAPTAPRPPPGPVRSTPATRSATAARRPTGLPAEPPGASTGLPNHQRRLGDLLASLGSAGKALDVTRGLDAGEATARLARDGANELLDITGRSDAEILVDQFRSVPVALLGVSAGLSLATRAYAEAGAIGAVLAANSGLGYVTERRAEQTVSALRQLGPREATVLRNGQPLTLDAREIVAGDVLLLKPGEPVPADARVIEAHRLATNEAALTGESLPVRKEPIDTLPADTPLGERRNMVYMGTVVSGGAGRAVVVATGERAALGRIRALAQGAESPRTQLQVELDRLGQRLAIGAVLLCGGVFALGLLRGRPMMPLLRTAVSLGVAAIPEGLPTVATSLLASSIRSLQQRQIYARRLDAVENLGAIDTVCFDKTGTLTENRMTVASLTVGERLVSLDDGTPEPALHEAWLRVAVLCNSVERVAADGSADRAWQGSSTELALVHYAIRRGGDADRLRRRHATLGVRHRSEHHPYMVTLHDATEGLLVAVKGRPDAVLERCEQWWDGERRRRLDAPRRRALLKLNAAMAARGERVLALAYRQQTDRRYGETGGLTWLGLVGLADPLRPHLVEMVERFQGAGIRPLMITGDQLGTAQAVADRVRLSGGRALVDAAQWPESADALLEIVEASGGFARTSPAMKLEIVRALQRRGHVVAMTGDGINDGPALKTADVGVAMGVTGTDFAHAMSDLVLRDDHPAAMLTAIEEGRTAFVNIQKSVRYLVSTNLSELATTAIAVAAGLPEPFEPLALLWTNLATDVWPAIALGLEPAEPGVLDRPPVSLRDGLLDRREWAAVATDTGAMTLATLASFGWGLARHGAAPQARTMAFMTLTSSQLLYALAMRSKRPLRAGGLKPNPMLTRAIGWSLAAQAATVLLPPARRLLRTTPLGPLDALVVAGTAVVPLLVREVLKERAA
jgi:P-type Ca2+ transporter type 2C